METARHDIASATMSAHHDSVSRVARPLLSVIIVAYKSCNEIDACLRSIPRLLLGRDVEIVVVDNSPGDGTGDLIRLRHGDVHYVAAPENLGFGRANNRGYAASRGELVLFLNPDTVTNEEALAHCVKRMQGDPTIGLVSPRLLQADGAMDLACRRSIPTLWDGFCRASGLAARFPARAIFAGYNLTHLPADGTYDVGAINGAFMMTARSVLRKVAPAGAVFDEHFFMYGDDLDLCIRVARAGYRIIYDGTVMITHLKGMSVGKDYDAMSHAIFDANRDVYLKHFAESEFSRWKYRLAFGLWKRIALARARSRGHRRVRPV